MGRQIKGLLYFYITDIQRSLKIFWSILLGILILSLAIGYFLLRFDEGGFFFGLSFPVYVYCAILGFITVKESIPFSLKMGAVRKNLFISIGILFLGIAIVKAVIASTLQTITLIFADIAGIHTFQFIHLAQFITDNWLNRVLIDTAIMFFLLSFMFIIGLLFYKSGMLGAGIVIGLLTVGLLLGIAQGWLIDFIINLFKGLDMAFIAQIFGVGLVVYGISFLLLRKVTTVNVK
ncbi:hypothetical protein [Oceanobacillus massiliensis]|uniref:hypothetical protein n=1 Tax=Oceanobacillus massiliensis TaxID=1465765 RepID=UPI000288CC2A|nr:hypothetical protein [Oceanobacillus massiliensis]